ncbi:outer membrane beta-barrel protein [Cyclobacterium sp. 1_MG-2023]|uniref:outer membrane beta-barrel protein n=1 Tax=Cyclobacterium sp. 1_MG-2023 TaxID=3062681 RepID=UPI0026E211EA|nr:outer membrane beta-barrel protein [Cyclobacterium sp. 1_MG-2023]MDO6437868.1 outer membrane beta-barrel protein [Cyclobacterium sp. 1_MG-2023]
MRIFTFLTFFALLMASTPLLAQRNRQGPPLIRGIVVDQNSQDPMIGANVLLKTQGDSLISNTTTGADGSFTIAHPRLPVFKLEVSYVGFEKVTMELSRGMTLDLGKISIGEDSQLLGEVTIEGENVVGEMRGDTAVFNASAFKTRENGMAEDLIGKLPGVTIENGKVQAQGEDVQKILVDGREFFGSDPSIALKNLPADAISSVEVLDQKSDQSRLTGLDDGNYAKTINIITKGNMRNSYFGRVYGGYGTDDRYSVGGNINFFNGARRISIIGMSNNVNQQNFSSDDMLGVSTGGGGRRRGGQSGGTFGVSQNNGIVTTNSLGVNYSDKWGEKINFTGSYFYNATENSILENTNRQTVVSEDVSQIYQENQISNITNNNHRANARMEYDINDKNALIIRPSINFQDNSSFTNLGGLNLDQNLDSLSDTRNETGINTNGFTISNNLTYRYKFDKKGRTFSTDVSTAWNERDQLTDLISANKDYVRNSFDTLVQQSSALSDGFNYTANFTYTEPISEKSVATASYQVGNNKSAADQKTFQLANEQGIMVLDTALSNEFDNKFFTQKTGLGYRYNNNGLNLNMEVDYQYAKLNNVSVFPTEGVFNRDFKNILPTVTMNYRNESGTRFRFRYRTRTNEPSVNQLQNVIDNTNPLNLSVGNPSLGQSYNNSIFANISKFDMETNRTFFMFLLGSFTSDYIGTSTFVAPQDTLINNDVLLSRGGQITTPVNLSGQMSTRLFINYGTSIPKLKTKVNFNPGVSYSRTPGIINGQTNINENIDISQGITFASNISKDVDFNLSTRGSYSIVNSSLQSTLENNYYTQTSNLKFYYSPNDGKTFISNNVSHVLYSGLAEGFDQSIWLWNIEAGYRFLKNNKGELKVYVFDLLKQNNSVSRTISDVSVSDVYSNVMTRYAMVSFTYIIGKFKKSDLPADDRGGRPGGYPGRRPGGARSW